VVRTPLVCVGCVVRVAHGEAWLVGGMSLVRVAHGVAWLVDGNSSSVLELGAPFVLAPQILVEEGKGCMV